MKYPAIRNFINGQFVAAPSARTLDVVSPVDGTHLSTVPMSTAEELKKAKSWCITHDVSEAFEEEINRVLETINVSS